MPKPSALQEKVDRLEAELSRLHRIEALSYRLNRTRSEDELLAVLYEYARPLGQCDWAHLYYIYLDEHKNPTEAVLMARQFEVSVEGFRVGMRLDLSKQRFTNHWFSQPDAPILVEDVETDERMDDHTRQLHLQAGNQAVAVVPMTQSGRWVGLVLFGWFQPHEFSEEEAGLYSVFTSLVPPIVENRRFLLEKQQRPLDTLYQISQQLNQAQTLRGILQAITGPLGDRAPDTASLFYTVTNATETPLEMVLEETLTVRESEVETAPPGMRVRFADFEFSKIWLATPDQAQITADVQTRPDFDEAYRNMLLGQNIRAGVLVPLRQAERWQGLITLEWDQPQNFAGQEVAVFEALPLLVAPVVANLRFVADLEEVINERTVQLRQNEARLETLFEVSRGLSAATSEDDLLRAVVEPLGFADLTYAGLDYLEVDDEGQPEIIEVAATYPGELPGIRVGTRIRIDQTSLAPLLDQSELTTIYVDTLSDRQLKDIARNTLAAFDMQSAAVLPLSQGGRWIGLIQLFWREAHVFTAQEKAVLDTLPALVSSAVASRRSLLEQSRLQEQLIQAQQQAIAELSTPIIPIMDRVIVLPLVGAIDTRRARQITRSLLAGISEHRASVVILDITGVSVVDSGVAASLDKTIQAARLKGTHTILTGITDAVAETIVDLGIDWSQLETVSNLQTALRAALNYTRR